MGIIKAEAPGVEYEVNSRAEFEELLEQYNEAVLLEETGEMLDEREFTFTLQDTHESFVGEEIAIHEIDNADEYMDKLEYYGDGEMAALFYLTDSLGYGFINAVEKVEDVFVFHGDLDDAAQEESYNFNVPSELEKYIDWYAYGEDCVTNGEWGTINYNGDNYVIKNAYSL